MRTLVNSLHPDDYQDMTVEHNILVDVCAKFHANSLPIVIPHHHRFWEYSTVLMMVLTYYKGIMSEFTFMDVGAGPGLIGPALSYLYDINVTECEPVPTEQESRYAVNAYLKANSKKEIRLLSCGTDNLPDEQFDMVSCISVIEHMSMDVESRCWKNLVEHIKPGGIFFFDVDCVPSAGTYVHDHMRGHNFVIEELKGKVELLKSLGMIPIGEPDYTWNGAHVWDYTFFRGGFTKCITV